MADRKAKPQQVAVACAVKADIIYQTPSKDKQKVDDA
jgi:hypothetical protein